jgi:glucosamine--fructose-6-phosphate aminotransferase (isomerizing)
MCGIIGYIGHRPAASPILDGLERLEYRGYDSAGMGFLNPSHEFELYRSVGRVASLQQTLDPAKHTSCMGIGHTRWATHGKVTVENTHPHKSYHSHFILVHNGVIENFKELKRFLLQQHYAFYSETDTEVLVNFIEYHYLRETPAGVETFQKSVLHALQEVQGTYGIALLCRDFPDHLLAARNSSPLLIGIGKQEQIIASDAAAIAHHTSRVIYLRDHELALLSRDEIYLSSFHTENIPLEINTIDWSPEEADRGPYEHYMQKEIHEQPQVIENAARGRISEDASTPRFGGILSLLDQLRHVKRIVICACGSAWHAGLEAEYLIEHYAHIPVEVEYASEFRYRNAPIEKHTLLIVISQSGETLDTLEAVAEAKRKGYTVMGISNVVGSSIARATDAGIYQHAGPEIGVASTKAFSSQLCILAMLAIYLGRLGPMNSAEGVDFCQALQELPKKIEEVLLLEPLVAEIARRYHSHEHFLFLGRQTLFPIALEGALKLKEISYIHAEGYPVAEMKHGPIAMISPQCPSFVLETQPAFFQKTLSNIQEIRARHGAIILVTTANISIGPGEVEEHIVIPQTHPALQPILATIPTQCFAYHMALLRGCDVDKPRNLAKSVTVE